MKTYRVTWEIDIESDDPVAAARKALEIQRDPDSIATVFEVRDRSSSPLHAFEVDLSMDEPQCRCTGCGRQFEMLKKRKTRKRKTK